MKSQSKIIKKPGMRSLFRFKLGRACYSFKRYILWIVYHDHFARGKSQVKLPFLHFRHQTVLLRQLKDVDMRYQYNKIVNLQLAVEKLDGLIIRSGETFSFWNRVGKPSYAKGYKDGLVLSQGRIGHGCGGGMCQLTNLIYWMTLHTQLKVIERHRHGYDVFPDNNRTQPFGSGATCLYPYLDLMVRNDTDKDFQLCLEVGEENLSGEWRSNEGVEYLYQVKEKNHCFRGEYWGGYSRHNELYRRVYTAGGDFLGEEPITENHAIMMYAPFIEESPAKSRAVD